jgi:hypothetical protein
MLMQDKRKPPRGESRRQNGEYGRPPKANLEAKAECRMQVRSEKSCVTGGESPSSLEAELSEFRMKVMNGKV